ncbi:MAG TPA: adenylate/guanylate cyclase domain-containing protein, partial [Gaiellales bacterium]|nr:adenylate/guanylate cyclase domain-containing protein [Gaiellales bacterium]
MSDTETRPGVVEQSAVERAFLIADVRGYTRFTRAHGDAAAARLAGAFASLARDAVAARGGRVIELRGDEALAVFESPRQAVRAAVDLVSLCAEEVAEQPDLPLLVGVGVDAGPAVPLEGGYRGAAINTAARLCSQAAAGQVLVPAALMEAAGALPGLRATPHGALELKGFETPLDVVEVRSARERPAERPHLLTVDPLPVELEAATPLVGREDEMCWLRGCWRQARRGDGRLLVVSGREGIGRTRLVAELAAVVRGQGLIGHAGGGGTALAAAEAELRAAAAADLPRLVVLDDVDVTAERLVPQIEAVLPLIEERPALVVCVVGDVDASADVAALVERVDRDGDAHRRLGPLGASEVQAIVDMYAGDAAGEVSVESVLRASGGVPDRVHELMSEWAEREAARRLEAAAEYLSAGRLERHAGLDFANNVIGLKLARLYTATPDALDLAPGACPYKGLASFEDDDSRFFFGREQLVGELAARTVGAGVLAVVGASGSGKSSVLAAGLVPSLRAGLLPGSDRWHIASMRPGDHPAAELDAVLDEPRDRDGRLVLVVDQFEELFASAVAEPERSACVDALTSLAADPERAIVVIGIRADFYGHCAVYPELARLVAANQVLVGAMGPKELRRAIELPARRCGVRIDAALVDRLVEEVADQPGGLPLLSTALVELWERRSSGWLRYADYEQAGGVSGAVARLAESSYEQLSERQRDVARALFLRLVTAGDDGVLTRRVVHRQELGLEPGADITAVVARLTADRLLTVTDDTVEVAHEALLREWPRLVEWLRQDTQGRELREHLIQAARRWEAAGRDTSELYRGTRLTA